MIGSPGTSGKTPRRIAVLRALQLGDMLCAIPALRALRARFPHARVTLIGLPWARAFVRRFDAYLDGFLEFPGFPGLPERPLVPRGFDRFLREAHALRFDLAIQMHGDGSITNGIVAMLDAARMVGFRGVDPDAVPPGMETLRWPDRGPEIRRLLALTTFLGAPPQGEQLEWPVKPDDMAALKRCAGASTLRAGAYACVHPGARSATRRWPVERFAEVADGLSEHGLRVVLTGSGEEQELTRAVSDRMKAPAVDLAGELDLGGMAAIIADARLLVSNDTGVSHLASALGVPSVIVFSASDPARWAPLDRARHRCVLPVVEGRIPCGHPGCHTDRPCSLSIPAEPVWREVRDLLESA